MNDRKFRRVLKQRIADENKRRSAYWDTFRYDKIILGIAILNITISLII